MSVDVSEIAPVTLADVMSRVRTLPNLGERRRQDLLSAVRLVCRALGRRPEEIPADPQRLRVWLTAISATEAGVGEARWRNGKSLFDSALEAAGIAMIRKRSKEPMTDLWTDLLQKISDRYIKARLTRLARFCTGRQTEPDHLDDVIMDEFRHALESDRHVERPKQVHRDACVTWNDCVVAIPDWPLQTLTVPDNRKIYAFCMSAFPPGFQTEAMAWLTDLGAPDLFGGTARKPARPVTITTRRILLLEVASALVLTGRDIASIESLADIVAFDAAKAALTWLWRHNGERKTGQLHNFSRLIVDIAKNKVGLPESELKRLGELRRQLDPGKGGMTETNKARLRPFEDPANVMRLIELPNTIMHMLSGVTVPTVKEAILAQSALGIAIQLAVPLRPRNLAHLTLDRHIVRTGPGPDAPVHIVIPRGEVKNALALEFLLPLHVIALLDLYLARFRPVLLKCPSRCLFPNQKGGPKDPGPFGTQIKKTIREHIGLVLNLHCFRHLCAFLFLKQHPGEYETVRLLLGHKDLATTVQYYCGLEQADAFRRYDALLDQFRQPRE
jgi:integrase